MSLWAAISWPLTNQQTVRACLLAHGDSHEIYAYTDLLDRDYPAVWNDVGVQVLTEGEIVGALHIPTDTETREARIYLWRGDFYLWIFRAWNSTAQPPAREQMPDGTMAWHGSCLLRLSA